MTFTKQLPLLVVVGAMGMLAAFLPSGASAQMVLDVPGANLNNVKAKNWDGSDGSEEAPPVGAEVELVLQTKDTGGNKKDIVIFRAPANAPSVHTHSGSDVHKATPGHNTVCHKYVYQGGKWVLVHICNY